MPGKIRIEMMKVFDTPARRAKPDDPAIWREKNPYVMTVRVTEGSIALEEYGWGIGEFSRTGTRPIYLGSLDTIERMGSQQRVERVTHNGTDANDVVTVEFLPDGWTMPQHALSQIVKTWGCVEFQVGAQ